MKPVLRLRALQVRAEQATTEVALNCHGGGAGSPWQSGDEAAVEGETGAVAESSKARAEAKAASGADEEDLTASMAAEGAETVAEVKVSGRTVKSEGGVVKGRASTGRRGRH